MGVRAAYSVAVSPGRSDSHDDRPAGWRPSSRLISSRSGRGPSPANTVFTRVGRDEPSRSALRLQNWRCPLRCDLNFVDVRSHGLETRAIPTDRAKENRVRARCTWSLDAGEKRTLIQKHKPEPRKHAYEIPDTPVAERWSALFCRRVAFAPPGAARILDDFNDNAKTG